MKKPKFVFWAFKKKDQGSTYYFKMNIKYNFMC